MRHATNMLDLLQQQNDYYILHDLAELNFI